MTQTAFLFPERAVRRQIDFSPFAVETEREVAVAFRRPPRTRPFPRDVPHYPYLDYHVSFRLGWRDSPQ